MGYTHYWRADPAALAEHPMASQVMDDIKRIAVASPVPITAGAGHYGAEFEVNGATDELRHEPFEWPPRAPFEFCKTVLKPYDVVVTACLAAAKYRLGDALEVSSDGRPSEWARGCALATEVLGEHVPCPLRPRDEPRHAG